MRHPSAGGLKTRAKDKRMTDFRSEVFDEAERAIRWGQNWDRACWVLIGLSLAYLGAHLAWWAIR